MFQMRDEQSLQVTKVSTIASAIDDMLAKGGVENKNVEKEKALVTSILLFDVSKEDHLNGSFKAESRRVAIMRAAHKENAVYEMLRGHNLMPMAKCYFTQSAVRMNLIMNLVLDKDQIITIFPGPKDQIITIFPSFFPFEHL